MQLDELLNNPEIEWIEEIAKNMVSMQIEIVKLKINMDEMKKTIKKGSACCICKDKNHKEIGEC